MIKRRRAGFLKRNSLTLVFLTLGMVVLVGQSITGWHEHNEYLKENNFPSIGILSYLGSGHFIQATFENLESEFLQMALFVFLTALLYQKGSSESNPLPEENKPEKIHRLTKRSPWPTRVGGTILKLYENSLFIVLMLIFMVAFFIHAYGSFKDYNTDAILRGEQIVGFWTHFESSRFWFESFQNWQSEFISIAAIVFLSIFFRQKGSSQSKHVNQPNSETKD